MIHHQVITVVFIFIVILSTALLTSAIISDCNQRCNRVHVPYPFGFSSSCQIRLSCGIDGDVRIGDFLVQNITNEYILINIPARCNRSIHDIKQLTSPNYRLTSRNNLLLQNCSSPLTSCVIPTSMVNNQFGLEGCESRINESISCFNDDYLSTEFVDFDRVSSTNCTILFSSIAVDVNNNTHRNSAVSLQFQVLELGWWLNGTCNCVDNANCTEVPLPDGVGGYRCRCRQGFVGDGFPGGKGCRRVPSSCNASRYISGRCGGTARIGILIGGAIAGTILMAAIALICYCIRRKSTSLKNTMSAKRLLSEAGGGSTIPLFPYKEIERATNGFSESQRLGTGAYGVVYAGKLNSDDWVAIKKIRHKDAEGFEQVMNEIKLLSSVSHPNLVRLLGCCIENDEQILVYEFMPNGTLSQHLQRERNDNNNRSLPWTIRLTIATETSHAIAHLHTMNPPIYHRDIKSSNILLDYNFNSKVADFGLSRLGMMDDSHISTAPQGTPGYVDPQYHQNFHLSDKSDVYSFGVVLIEIITAQKVVDFNRQNTEVNLAALAVDRIGKGRVDDIIDPFLDPHKDAWTLSSIHKVAELAFRCLAFHKDMRPSMMEVSDELEQIRLSSWAPMEDNISINSSSCSSPNRSRSEKSFGAMSVKKIGIESRRLIVPQNRVETFLNSTIEHNKNKDNSPVSVQDPWLSEQSSPSTNSLLGNVVR